MERSSWETRLREDTATNDSFLTFGHLSPFHMGDNNDEKGESMKGILKTGLLLGAMALAALFGQADTTLAGHGGPLQFIEGIHLQADSSDATDRPILMGGSDGSNLYRMLVDSAGAVSVNVLTGGGPAVLTTTHLSFTASGSDDSTTGTAVTLDGQTIVSVYFDASVGAAGAGSFVGQVSYNSGTTYVTVPGYYDVDIDKFDDAAIDIDQVETRYFIFDVRGADRFRLNFTDTNLNTTVVLATSVATSGAGSRTEYTINQNDEVADLSGFGQSIFGVRDDTPLAAKSGASGDLSYFSVDAWGGQYVRLLGTAGAAFDPSLTIATISSTVLQRVALFDASDAQITTFAGTEPTFGTDTYAEATDVGTQIGAYQDDTPLVSKTDTDGEFSPLSVDNWGGLYVRLLGTAGAALDQTIASTPLAVRLSDGTNFIDAAVMGTATYSEATTVGSLIAAIRDDTPLSSRADTNNELAPLSMDAVGGLYVRILGTAGAAWDPTASATALALIDDAIYAEDLLSATTNPGMAILAVQNEALATFTTGALDYTHLAVSTTGQLLSVPMHVTSISVPLQMSKRESVAHASADAGVMSLGITNDALASLATDGQYTAPQFNAAGAMYTTGRAWNTEEHGLAEIIGVDEAVAASQYAASLAVTFYGATNTMDKLCLYLQADVGATGVIYTPTGTVLIFDNDPGVGLGDTTLTGPEHETIVTKIEVVAADWHVDTNGGTACYTDLGDVTHDAASFLTYFSAAGEATWNAGAGDQEQLNFNFWYRRAS